MGISHQLSINSFSSDTWMSPLKIWLLSATIMQPLKTIFPVVYYYSILNLCPSLFPHLFFLTKFYIFFFSFLFLFSIWKILVTTQLCIKAPYLMKIFILITKISLESQTFIQLKNINLTPLYNFFIRRTVFWRNSDPNNSNNYIVQFQILMPIITSYRNITL